MNQHSVQKAYLKNFEVNGRICVYDKDLGKYFKRSANHCASETDYQSEEFESFQNKKIESPGILKLRALAEDIPLKEGDLEVILKWTALHGLRSKLFRKSSGVDYQAEFKERLEIDSLFANYFQYAFVYKSPKDKYFITSDHPVIDFTVQNKISRILVWSPTLAFGFSSIDDFPIHEVETTEIINSMIYSSCNNEIFTNQSTLPIETYEAHIKKWELEYEFKDRKFSVKY
ncbi:hypothetical protein GCM10009133_08480 [Cocleimonas flava]|uniref:Uncharacterized protein DUF4238 n=1 Tax=Cocleimonas flava TaxID=634765 RepID=A0A4R1F3Q4_9GAMM|nr:DUF4238 domain-containing protein [Cocleimonas flava]TCJ87212.1 uncharacterized protein DUF4238 [Cocleimonas flava]